MALAERQLRPVFDAAPEPDEDDVAILDAYSAAVSEARCAASFASMSSR